MEINNLSSSQNFQGYLKFKTTKNVVKTIDPSKIAAIVTGVAVIKQPFYLYKYDENYINLHKDEHTKTSPDGRSTAGVTVDREYLPIEVTVQQLIYSDPRVALPDTYSSDMRYNSKNSISNTYVEGSDYIVLNDKKMNDAFMSAIKSDGIVDIVEDCGRVPFDGIWDFNKRYAPIIENDKYICSGTMVAETYMESASGIATAEKEIGAEDVIISINDSEHKDKAGSDYTNKIVDMYHDKEPHITEDEKLEIVDYLEDIEV